MSLILAISGPTAVGKTTICERLIEEFGDGLSRLVTATTRTPRDSEKHGVDYFFFPKSEFQEKLSQNQFLEHENIYGNDYGILKESILFAQEKDMNILLNIDVNGSASLRKFCQETLLLHGCLKTIFIRPKSLDDLKRRMIQRASESAEQAQVRLVNAQSEMERQHEFDYIIESADKETDYQKIREIYLSLK
jgi:guanylate kinase